MCAEICERVELWEPPETWKQFDVMKITPGNVFFFNVFLQQFLWLTGHTVFFQENSVVHSYRSYHSAEMNSGTSGLVTRYSFTYIDGACNNQSAFLAEILITRTVLWLIFISAYSLFCLCNRFLCVCVSFNPGLNREPAYHKYPTKSKTAL